MSHRNRTLLFLALGLPLVAAPVSGCIATDSGLGQATQGCPEFQPGQTVDANLNVDVHVRQFMQSCADFAGASATMKSAVRNACEGMAHDLGVKDTWSSLGDVDDAISNPRGTGACDQVRARIDAIMTANVQANFALVVDRGACHPDFDAEASCESGCASAETCNPGTVQTRCDPVQLDVQCAGSCQANSFCEGHADVQTNCEGTCEGECTGTCTGRCTDDQGHRTDDDRNCHGKCSDHCSGTCSGRCKIDAQAGIQCGASVACEGGCTGDASSPRCETDFTPPTCNVDASCFASCRASVAAKAPCDPPTVKLLADVTVSADVKALVDTVDRNLPPLFQTAEVQGKIVLDVADSLDASGKAILGSAGNLDGKSIACATVAAQSLGSAATTLQVSAQAGGAVTSDCGSHAD